MYKKNACLISKHVEIKKQVILRFAHNLMALSASLKFSILGTKRSISSVTLQPLRLLTHFWSRFLRSMSSLRSYKYGENLFDMQFIKKWRNIIYII